MRDPAWWATFAAVAALAAALAGWALLRAAARPRAEEDVRRLRELERRLGPAHPEVRRLRQRVWRYLLGYPDPIPWGRYRWKGSRIDAPGGRD